MCLGSWRRLWRLRGLRIVSRDDERRVGSKREATIVGFEVVDWFCRKLGW